MIYKTASATLFSQLNKKEREIDRDKDWKKEKERDMEIEKEYVRENEREEIQILFCLFENPQIEIFVDRWSTASLKLFSKLNS